MKHSELRHQPRHVNPRIQGIKKRLTDRTPVNLTETELKGQDNRPTTSKTALSTHIVDKTVLNS